MTSLNLNDWAKKASRDFFKDERISNVLPDQDPEFTLVFKDVVAKKKNFGDYILTFRLNKWNELKIDTAVSTLSMRDTADAQRIHPHIWNSGMGLCAGDYSKTLFNLAFNGEILAFSDIMEELLTNPSYGVGNFKPDMSICERCYDAFKDLTHKATVCGLCKSYGY